MDKSATQFIFLAFAASGKGISGSDRIFIELAKRWSKIAPLTLFVWEEGYEMCKRQKLVSSIKYQVVSMEPWKRMGFIINYFARIIEGIRSGFSLKLDNKPSTIIYSASEFWMDSLPAFILKRRFKDITWVAAWFQTAPNPLVGFSAGKRENTYKLSAFFYWLVQLPIKPIIARFADYVLINNELEKKQFPRLTRQKKVIVLIGAVNINDIEIFMKKNRQLKKMYDAVFQGRFHPQKGVVELIEIWKKVVSKESTAKLVMIGDGPLMEDARRKIKELRLEKNIELLGYVFDGDKKYKTFAQSKIVVHPAFYDSGGMAAAEAMAFGLPCVGFDLKAYESYYPKGIMKAKYGHLDEFAEIINTFLQNTKLREKIGKEAQQMILTNYSWDKRAEEVYRQIERSKR